VLPAPPDPSRLDPLLTERGVLRLYRVHPAVRSPTAFNPGLGRPTRFAPLRDATRVIPTLYLGETIEGTLSESVFHDVEPRGPKKLVYRSRLRGLAVSRVLAETGHHAMLEGPGLMRLGLRRREIIDTSKDMYPRTIPWALALHDCPAGPAGLVWRARHDDRSRAYVLFEDAGDLLLADPDYPTLPLWEGAGLAAVLEFAEMAKIDIVI
jgi:hypothetical protein